ncbi:MAG: type II toxin-antitoxin system HicB family antitoxin [Candidatus Pristimantibacillus sp.]
MNSQTKTFTILVEEDYASNNYCGYVPELRLSVVGDDEEEVISCAKDLITIEMQNDPDRKIFSSKVVQVQIDLPEILSITA